MAKYNAEQLAAMQKAGHTFPGGTSYPIGDAEDLNNAIQAVGRGGADHDAIRRYVMRRAREMGMTSKIPDSWAPDGSIRSDEVGLEEGGFIRERLWTPDLEFRSDGRTLFGMVVPYGQAATVNDGRGNYQEMFVHGAFGRTINGGAGSRVKLMANHDTKRFPVGKASLLREDTAGLYGEFHVSNTRDGDEVIELVRDGVLDAFSVGFRPVKSRRNGEGVVERQEVALREVSVVAFPAYAGAAIAGLRQGGGMPASFSMPMSGIVSHDGAGAMTMQMQCDTPGEETAESAPRSVDPAVDPPTHSTGPTSSERRLWALKVRGVQAS